MSTEINLLNGKHAYSVQDCVSEDSDHVWCDGVWLCKQFLSWQWITVPLSSATSSPRRVLWP